jgi:hypothetical protein
MHTNLISREVLRRASRAQRLVSAAILSSALATGILLCAMAATAASAFVAPAGTPDLSKMVLQPADLALAGKVRQGYLAAPGFVAAYQRVFGPSIASNGQPLLAIYTKVWLAADANTATLQYAPVQGMFRSRAFDRSFARAIAGSRGGRHRTRMTVRVGAISSPGVGDDSLLVPLRVGAQGLQIPIDVVLLRVDRTVGLIVLIGMPNATISRATITGVAGSIADHIRAGLLPQSTGAPTVTGIAAEGQPLTATAGTWTNDPTGFSYQWQRCNAGGSSCAAIAGATGQSYTATSADAGDTLEVTVTATNSDGRSTPATSSPTAIVS